MTTGIAEIHYYAYGARKVDNGSANQSCSVKREVNITYDVPVNFWGGTGRLLSVEVGKGKK